MSSHYKWSLVWIVFAIIALIAGDEEVFLVAIIISTIWKATER